MTISRRRFLEGMSCAALTAAAMSAPRSLAADASQVPIGLELYTVDNNMKADFDGTLRQIAAIGYRDIEFPWYYGRSASQVLRSLQAAGLRCRSGLVLPEELESDLSAQIDFAHELGLKYMGCVMMRLNEDGQTDIDAVLERLTLDDFKRNAELYNRIGEQTRKAGIQFTYHNHNFEFRKYDGVVGYDELLRLTDPQLVQMEMDVGWVAWAGYDPVRYLREHPGRTALLHVRDLKLDVPRKPLEMHSVEIGSGVIDWQDLLAAARESGVTMGYVEQDPTSARTSLASAGTSFGYLRGLRY